MGAFSLKGETLEAVAAALHTLAMRGNDPIYRDLSTTAKARVQRRAQTLSHLLGSRNVSLKQKRKS